MKSLLRGTLVAALAGLALAIAGCGGGGGSTSPLPTTVVQPLALPGPYTVGCSNVAQDFSLVAAGEEAKDYWEGFPSASGAPSVAGGGDDHVVIPYNGPVLY